VKWLRLDNRFLPPLLITSILLTAHLSFGILEGWERTGLAIVTAFATEMARAFISIASKYVLRFRGRHLWNPSNLGVSLVLFLAPDTVSLLSVQWGNVVAPMVVIWLLGSVIVWRVGRFYLSATYVASFLLFSFVRAAVTGVPWVAAVAPITGPMYQLFIFFMVTDPKVTVRPMWAQCLVVFIVAFVELILRLNEVVYAPFYALCLVGPSALLVEMWLDARRAKMHVAAGLEARPRGSVV
jgi:hypothetical protein